MDHPLFPVDKSLLSSDALGQMFAVTYSLAEARCQLLSSSMRDVYLVISGDGRYIFYLYRHDQQTAAQIAAEWRFVDYLAANGLAVAAAIPAKNGDQLIRFHAPEGERIGVLAPFIPGDHFRRRPGVKAAKEIGRLTGRMHTLTEHMPFELDRPALDLCHQLNSFATVFQKTFPERAQDAAIMVAAVALLCREMVDFPRQGPDFGMIHGDLIRANVQVGDDGRITLLDFDLCAPGWRAYDLASFLYTLKGMAEEAAIAQAFLAGYAEVRELTPFTQQALPVFSAARAVFTIGVPAANAYHWGRARVEPWLDDGFARLRSYLTT